ncbi:MAG: Undecaprenyl-diphosphatase [Parcubacteria group bacterium GW2011_GWA2_43_17]|nr:MAG: Undecaprenyl-diphosphatase [Parcubacteria group bacterium GW2011_GWA2_43_17]KKT92123.1 MAG: Undecaprenyl-diphosphatase [Parcubacteria group bacterium GW2011_GWF2_45_11]KKT97379.1 MAG: Undecaprenyl-diphosphatase [Parcubacteria group bacterium GW2011_GWC2_45_15]OGY92700.1 MAG: undecaprenyl-diphosphatase UppP [Candidatus Komeilibacteria bacterium RIFOXYA2_FULL_45_9]OGY96190.1 MAG: undecaprenyl-diphosphatase UppP [Candidatus Komeilibacteria bacterium RIFOXYC2_FULL_45_12]HAH04116.1 undecapr
MDYIITIVLAAVQALTEFLPISSSGHLVIFHQLIRSDLLNNLTFDVILHGGTLLAAIVYFWSDLIGILKGFILSLLRKNQRSDFNRNFAWVTIVGTIPGAVVGYFFSEIIEQIFRSVVWVMVMLVVGGVLFIIAEKFSRRQRDLKSMTIGDGLMIGLAQVLSFIPGTSRSGITMAAGLLLNFKRREAARFSFLLSVPIVLGANIRKISQINLADLSVNFVFVSILGVAVATLIGYIVIGGLLKFLEKHSLTYFAVYRFILAAVLAAMFLL